MKSIKKLGAIVALALAGISSHALNIDFRIVTPTVLEFDVRHYWEGNDITSKLTPGAYVLAQAATVSTGGFTVAYTWITQDGAITDAWSWNAWKITQAKPYALVRGKNNEWAIRYRFER